MSQVVAMTPDGFSATGKHVATKVSIMMLQPSAAAVRIYMDVQPPFTAEYDTGISCLQVLRSSVTRLLEHTRQSVPDRQVLLALK